MIGETPPSRPCLPAVEKLDDRLLLSAVTQAASDGGNETPYKGDTQILIGLLLGQQDLIKGEISAFNSIGDLKIDAHKLSESFRRIDEGVYKLGEALINGDLSDHKVDKTAADLQVEFQKIDMLVGGLGSDAGSEFKIKIGELEQKVDGLVNDLTISTDAGDLDHKTERTYLSVADSFLRLDDAILKYESDVVQDKTHKADMKFLEIELQDVQISSYKIDDTRLQGEIQSLAQETFKLVAPPTFTGGVTTDGGDTGDVLA
jgi:type VI protein secretion system component Hcp